MDETGMKFTEAASDAIVTGFTRAEMQELADDLNSGRIGGLPPFNSDFPD